MSFDFENGEVLLFNKPLGWTSFDLVKKVKSLTKAKKVGHAGTLDPLATGLMILCTGKMTKQIDKFQGMEKEYTGSIFLGESTVSYDREQPVEQTMPISHISDTDIYAAASGFTGIISQFPPPHSAVKVDGKRAYTLARKGEVVDIKAREVTIQTFEITNVTLPVISFKVVCSKGTYIRSLAHDFGKALGTVACLDALCRTRIGEFELNEAFELEGFMAKLGN